MYCYILNYQFLLVYLFILRNLRKTFVLPVNLLMINLHAIISRVLESTLQVQHHGTYKIILLPLGPVTFVNLNVPLALRTLEEK